MFVMRKRRNERKFENKNIHENIQLSKVMKKNIFDLTDN